jgi:hypothetical protein
MNAPRVWRGMNRRSARQITRFRGDRDQVHRTRAAIVGRADGVANDVYAKALSTQPERDVHESTGAWLRKAGD